MKRDVLAAASPAGERALTAVASPLVAPPRRGGAAKTSLFIQKVFDCTWYKEEGRPRRMAGQSFSDSLEGQRIVILTGA